MNFVLVPFTTERDASNIDDEGYLLCHIVTENANDQAPLDLLVKKFNIKKQQFIVKPRIDKSVSDFATLDDITQAYLAVSDNEVICNDVHVTLTGDVPVVKIKMDLDFNFRPDELSRQDNKKSVVYFKPRISKFKDGKINLIGFEKCNGIKPLSGLWAIPVVCLGVNTFDKLPTLESLEFADTDFKAFGGNVFTAKSFADTWSPNYDYELKTMVKARIELENLIFYPFGSINRGKNLIEDFKKRFLKVKDELEGEQQSGS